MVNGLLYSVLRVVGDLKNKNKCLLLPSDYILSRLLFHVKRNSAKCLEKSVHLVRFKLVCIIFVSDATDKWVSHLSS